MQKKTQVVLSTAALLAGAAVFFSAPQNKDIVPSAVVSPDKHQQPAEQISLSDNKVTTATDGLISLAGTHHGVALASRDGELIVTAALRDLFDYYLSAIGEVSQTQLVAKIEQDLQNQLAGRGLEQALLILNNYLSYKTELIEFDKQYPANKKATDAEKVDYLTKRQLALVALQDAQMGVQVAQIFFEYDRTMDEHNLAKSRILLSDMSQESKDQALINLNAQLPFDAFQHQQRNHKQQQLMAIESAPGLSEQQKFQQRSEIVGEAAANRLAELDKQRAEWRGRLNKFQQELNTLIEARMAAEDFEAAYQKLLDQHFESHEQLRAKALTK
jgi:lipase chaperone LimK